MEHFYHCKSLWINHDYERTPMCMWACAHAWLATLRCFVLAPQPLLNTPHPPTSLPFYRVFFMLSWRSASPRGRHRHCHRFFFSPTHPSSIMLKFFSFFWCGHFQNEIFYKWTISVVTVKRTGRRIERRDQCDWISPTKPQSVITSFYGSAEQDLKWLIAVCRGKLFVQ